MAFGELPWEETGRWLAPAERERKAQMAPLGSTLGF